MTNSGVTRVAEAASWFVHYALEQGIIEPEDQAWAFNRLLEAVGAYGPAPLEAAADAFTLDTALDELAAWVSGASKVYCMGFYLSNLPARFLSVALRALHGVDADNPEYDFVMRQFHSDELIVLFSVRSGEQYREFMKVLAKLPDAERPRIALITMNPKHLLRSYCDSVIVLPSADSVGRERIAIIDNMLYMMFNEMLLTKVRELTDQQ